MPSRLTTTYREKSPARRTLLEVVRAPDLLYGVAYPPGGRSDRAAVLRPVEDYQSL